MLGPVLSENHKNWFPAKEKENLSYLSQKLVPIKQSKNRQSAKIKSGKKIGATP